MRSAARDAMKYQERLAYEDWRQGNVDPWRITVALDARGLFGPEVDHACGVEEPDVDQWEAGEKYPTWPQLCALAALTGNTVRFFTLGPPPLYGLATSARWHGGELEPRTPVVRFTEAAVEATVGAA